MKPSSPKTFFVSYSRKDAAIVRPVVEIMRATGTYVFRDEDSIPPGKRWRDVLSQSIQDSDVIALFWSKNSASSPAVASEYNEGISLGKDIIPILLDDEPLSSALREFQYIDFRSIHDSIYAAGDNWSRLEEEFRNVLANAILHTIGVRPVKHIIRAVSPLNDIFIAHSIHGVREAIKLFKEFQKFGLTVQQWSMPQDDFEWLSSNVYQQMRDSRIVLLVITRSDLHKPQITDVGTSLRYMTTHCVPILVDCEHVELPSNLREIQAYKFRDHKKYLQFVNDLIIRDKEIQQNET